jgi:hypothetical protein
MTTKLFVPKQEFKQIEKAIKESGVKFYPFMKNNDGYNIRIEPLDHPLVSYLALKYDVTQTQID